MTAWCLHHTKSPRFSSLHPLQFPYASTICLNRRLVVRLFATSFMQLSGFINWQGLKMGILATNLLLTRLLRRQVLFLVGLLRSGSLLPGDHRLLKHYWGSNICLTLRFVCVCVLTYACFSSFLRFYVLGRLTLSLKTDIIGFLWHCSNVDGHREGSWVNIARNIHMHDKHSKKNVLSSKSLSKLEAIGVDSCGFSNSQR